MKPFRSSFCSSVFVLALLVCVPSFADTVQGRVASSLSNSVNLTVYDNQGRPYPNALRVKVDNNTRFTNVLSTGMLRKGDYVSATVSQERSGEWKADSISRIMKADAYAAPAPNPSESLMNALRSPTGQKMIKQGLTGAVVGATASASSGGKMGKGALIGAGVSILGGFLQDILSAPGNIFAPSNSSSAPATYRDDNRY